MIKVDFIKEIKYTKDSFSGVCDCCNKKLKKSFICIVNKNEVTLGANCLFGSKQKISEYEKAEFFLMVKTNNWKQKYEATSDLHREILLSKDLLK